MTTPVGEGEPAPGPGPGPGAAPGASRSLRARIQRAITGAVGLALLLFAVPLAVALGFVVHDDAVTALQRDATRAAVQVPDNTVEIRGPVVVPAHSGRAHIGVYTADGALAAGAGPARSGLAMSARDGQEHDGREDGELATVVPVLSDGTVVGTVRAAIPVRDVVVRTLAWWVGLVALAGVVLAVTRVVGRRLASRVAAPVEQLTAAARSLGDGRFDLALPVWGLREADEAGAALQETARRIGTTVRRERVFNRDVSHQLRTPLAGLLTGLETALADPDDATRGAALTVALDRARHLQTTIDDLLLVRRPGPGEGRSDLGAEARAAVARLHVPPDRAVELRIDHVPDAGCAGAVVRQALDVLLDNAVRHGSGTITVTVEQLGESVLVEVADEGPGFPDGSTPGTGLQLASDLAQSAYGSLMIRNRGPRPRVAFLVPAVDEPTAQSSS
jgi:signal transduction histidine kinase